MSSEKGCKGELHKGFVCLELDCKKAPVKGACCLPMGACMQVAEIPCKGLGGQFSPKKACKDVTCKQPSK